MKKIPFDQFEKIMTYDVVENNSCVEIEFLVDGFREYGSCWLGKTIDSATNQAIFWYGLASDGSEAYDFRSLCDFTSEPIFHGNNLKEIWGSITLISIDSCDIDWRLTHYLSID